MEKIHTDYKQRNRKEFRLNFSNRSIVAVLLWGLHVYKERELPGERVTLALTRFLFFSLS